MQKIASKRKNCAFKENLIWVFVSATFTERTVYNIHVPLHCPRRCGAAATSAPATSSWTSASGRSARRNGSAPSSWPPPTGWTIPTGICWSWAAAPSTTTPASSGRWPSPWTGGARRVKEAPSAAVTYKQTGKKKRSSDLKTQQCRTRNAQHKNWSILCRARYKLVFVLFVFLVVVVVVVVSRRSYARWTAFGIVGVTSAVAGVFLCVRRPHSCRRYSIGWINYTNKHKYTSAAILF